MAQSTLGAELRRLRESHGMEQQAVARTAKIAVSTLRRWETGEFQPSISELDDILKALNADTPAIQIWFYNQIQGPRAGNALRLLAKKKGIDVLSQFLPGSGDLLRSMRTRRGWTSRQLAQFLRVDAGQISRWEKGDVPIPQEQQQRICTCLGATPDESKALASQAALFSSIPLERMSRDELEAAIATIGQHVFSGDRRVSDLTFLYFESSLWKRSVVNPSFLRLYGRCINYHNIWLDQHEIRAGLAVRAQRVLDMVPGCLEKEGAWWMNAIGHAARAMRDEDRRLTQRTSVRGHRNALSLFEEYLPQVPFGERDQILRDMAPLLHHLGYRDEAYRTLAEASQVAERFNEQMGREVCAMLTAQLCLDDHNPGGAFAALPAIVPLEKDANLATQQTLLWARAHHLAGDTSEAADYFARFFDYVNRFGYDTLRQEGELFANQL